MAVERYIELQLIKPLVKGSGVKGKISLTNLFKEYFEKLNVGYLDPCCPEGSAGAFGCPAISPDADNALECRPNGLYAAGGGAGSANNGLSVDGSNIVLGQLVGDVSNPALITSAREIPTGNNSIFWTGALSRHVFGAPNASVTPFSTVDIRGSLGVSNGLNYPAPFIGSPASVYVVHGAGNFGLSVTRVGVNQNAANFTMYRTWGATADLRVAVPPGNMIGRMAFMGVPADGTSLNINASIIVHAAPATNPGIGRGWFAFTVTGEDGGQSYIRTVISCNNNVTFSDTHLIAAQADGESDHSKLRLEQVVTGTNAYSILSMTPTWNTTGIPTAINLVVTDTASDATSALLNLQVGATSIFKVRKTLDEYADNAAAVTAGLTVGTVYRTADVLKIVH